MKTHLVRDIKPIPRSRHLRVEPVQEERIKEHAGRLRSSSRGRDDPSEGQWRRAGAYVCLTVHFVSADLEFAHQIPFRVSESEDIARHGPFNRAWLASIGREAAGDTSPYEPHVALDD